MDLWGVARGDAWSTRDLGGALEAEEVVGGRGHLCFGGRGAGVWEPSCLASILHPGVWMWLGDCAFFIRTETGSEMQWCLPVRDFTPSCCVHLPLNFL